MAFKKDDIIIIEPREVFVGKKDAPVTLIEFGEYENEECAKVNEIVKQWEEDDKPEIKAEESEVEGLDTISISTNK